MARSKPYQNTVALFDDLIQMVQETEQKVFDDELYFVQHVNFFTKSFIITICAYLEDYIKDMVMLVIDDVNTKLTKNTIPHNLVVWSLDKSGKLKKPIFNDFQLNINKNDIDEHISANFWRTKDIFIKIGINLSQTSNFLDCEERIKEIVTKRNNIIHHNDQASDISLNDLIEHIEFIKKYMEIIDVAVAEHL